MALAVRVCQLATRLPKHEAYGLGADLRQAVVAVPARIAEAMACPSPAEFMQLLLIARYATAELETHLQVAQRIGCVAADEAATCQGAIDEIGRLLNAELAGHDRRRG